MSGERTNLQQKYSDKKIKKYRRINGNLGGRKKEGEREREIEWERIGKCDEEKEEFRRVIRRRKTTEEYTNWENTSFE